MGLSAIEENLSALLTDLLLRLGQARLERRSGEDLIHICSDRLGARRQRDPESRQPPQNGSNGAIHERKFIAEKERLGRKDIDAGQNALLESAERAGGLRSPAARMSSASEYQSFSMR